MMVLFLCSQYDLCQVQPRLLLALPEALETDAQGLLQLLGHGGFTLRLHFCKTQQFVQII